MFINARLVKNLKISIFLRFLTFLFSLLEKILILLYYIYND